MSIKDEFVIQTLSDEKTEPYYILRYEMDSNDGDYIGGSSQYSKKSWDEKFEFFFLMLAYLSQGYSGKFSHGKDWGDYYGHHVAENAHGLSEEIGAFQEYYDIVCYSDWGSCHSYSDFTLEYYDEQNRKHDVYIPSIDNLFATEEEMIKAIKDAYQKFLKDTEEE